jgi:PIN domain nuclease of toxin-antitoxin system
VRILLDTQAFLYFVLDSPALSRRALSLIQDPVNQVLLSLISVWEIAIKVSTGKLQLHEPIEEFIPGQLQVNQFLLLPLGLEHTLLVATLPLHHRDPFDRMLVAQSMVEGVPLISSDATLDQYPIERLW